jgi:hypothetical protein
MPNRLDIQWRTSEKQDSYGEFDRKVVYWLDHHPHVERYIFTHIAGVSFPNLDGSSRQDALARCKRMEGLTFQWEENNPVSRTAIAVHRVDTGEQLGYLESRLGRETFNRLRKGEIWIGFIVSMGAPHESEAEAMGATIVVVKLKPEVLHENVATPHSSSPAEPIPQPIPVQKPIQVVPVQVAHPTAKPVFFRSVPAWAVALVILCVLLPLVFAALSLILR